MELNQYLPALSRINTGKSINLDRIITPESQKIIKGAIELLGIEKLKPIWEHLEGNYSYDEISLVARASQKSK